MLITGISGAAPSSKTTPLMLTSPAGAGVACAFASGFAGSFFGASGFGTSGFGASVFGVPDFSSAFISAGALAGAAFGTSTPAGLSGGVFASCGLFGLGAPGGSDGLPFVASPGWNGCVG